jgi:protease-4
LRLDRPLNPQVAETLASGVNFTYREFLQLVANGRGLSEEAVQAAAGGRVWSAADAQALGLIDELGSLREAIAAAAELGGLDPQQSPVEYVQQPLSPRDMLLRQLASRVGVTGLLPGLDGGMQQLLQPVATAASTLTELNDPAHLYMRCVGCAAP